MIDATVLLYIIAANTSLLVIAKIVAPAYTAFAQRMDYVHWKYQDKRRWAAYGIRAW